MLQNKQQDRESLLSNGYCVVDGGLPEGQLERLQQWSVDWLNKIKHSKRWKYQGSDVKLSGLKTADQVGLNLPADAMVDFLIEHPKPILDALGMPDFKSIGLFQIIAKPARSPALYWHQDWMQWNDPISLSPWCQTVFLNWYLTDTHPHNGALRVIPGTHRRRIDLHDHLTPPHEGGGYDVSGSDPWMFYDHPDAIDVPVKAGQLVIADARLLHATHPNDSDELRTLLLGWYSRKATSAPDWWRRGVPAEIQNRDPNLRSERSRIPGRFLR